MHLTSSVANIIEKAMTTEEAPEAFAQLLPVMCERMGGNTWSFMVSDRGMLLRKMQDGFVHDDNISSAHDKISDAVFINGKMLFATGDEMKAGTPADRYIAYPLKMGQKVTGVISVSREGAAFTDEEVESGRFFACIIGLLLERARIYLEKHVNENLQVIGMLKSSVAHDISNMLGIVRVYLELMESEADHGSIIADYLEAVKGEISRIASLATDMLDLSKKHVNLTKAEFSVNKFIAELERQSKVLVKDSQIEISYRVEGDICIVADENRLYRVFFNIIKNASEALKGVGNIKFKVRRVKDHAYFIIMDNGKGISPENIKVLFNPFFTSGKASGTGLGLAVVKDMVYAHGGTVKVRSQEGRYTCFVIRIPVNG